MTKASVKYKLQYTFSDTSWSRITKTKNLKLKFWTNLHKISVLVSSVWEQGWCSGESTRLPPMWPGSNPGVNAICGLSLLLVLSLAQRGFSPGTPVFPSPQKPTFPNSNSTRNQVDEEPLCGCVTCKFLFIYLFILFLSAVQGCTCSYKERLSMLFNNSSWHFYTTSPSKLPLFHFPEQFELAC